LKELDCMGGVLLVGVFLDDDSRRKCRRMGEGLSDYWEPKDEEWKGEHVTLAVKKRWGRGGEEFWDKVADLVGEEVAFEVTKVANDGHLSAVQVECGDSRVRARAKRVEISRDARRELHSGKPRS